MERIDRMEGQLAGVAAEAQGARRASVAFAARGADPREGTDPEVLAKAERRQFSAEYKRRILREADAARDAGKIGALLLREGLKVPHKQPQRGRLWLADRSCIRLRPQQRNHVWSYDFVEDRTHDGRKYRMLNVIDEFTHECLAIWVARKLKAIDVIDVLSALFILRGVPGQMRSDNGPGLVARAVQQWITAVGAKTATSPLAALGRTASSRASTHPCAMNYPMVKSSTRCVRLRPS